MAIRNVIEADSIKWMEAEGLAVDIVISSRIRLARNIRQVPFPHLLDEVKGQECLEQIKKVWQTTGNRILGEMDMQGFDQLSTLDREILVEKHLISPTHAKSEAASHAVLINDDGSLSTMINEEDHLRIQCLLSGLQLQQCCQQAQELDDALEEKLDYAFDERRGYLTCCPTNVGTGLRASVMLHLPAMQMTGQANQVLPNIGQLGMTIRGLYGEGSEVVGSFFQLSNQVTLGQSEEDICNYLHNITLQIVEQERLLREKLQAEMKYQLEDKIGRAYGILTNARMITSNEALTYLSQVRMGVDMGILKGINPRALNELVVAIRPGHLQRKASRDMLAAERDIKRAEVIQDKFKTMGGGPEGQLPSTGNN